MASPPGTGGREGFRLDIKGYAAFRRGINKLDKGLGKQLSDHVRKMAIKVRDDARRNAPVGPSGDLHKSIKHSVTVKQATIYSNLAYAPVHEWGGTIRPKGVPITIQRTRYIGRAIDDNAEHIESEMTSMFESLKRSSGF